MRNNNHSTHGIMVYVAITLALALVVTGVTALIRMNPTADAEAVQVSESATVVTSPFTEAVQKVHGSVVGVNNYTYYSNRNSYYSFGGFNFGFGNGFGNDFGGSQDDGQDNSRQVLQGSGSGVVVAKGYVLTNYHVVDGASMLEVTSGDNTYTATVAGSDESLDLAVLKVENMDIEPVTLGDSDKLSVGDWAICIGNPLSFTGTTTVGVISALNREIKSDATDAYGRRTDDVNLMIQTDAAINAGNSGGGMFNVAGELIGVPSMKYTGSYYSSTSVEGIGMAIPINVAKTLIQDVISGKAVEGNNAATDNGKDAVDSITPTAKPRMGVTVTTISNSNSSAVANGYWPTGAYVTNVEAGAPAEKAGIKIGDIVVDVDGNVITTSSQMVNLLQQKQAGDSVAIKVFRPARDEQDNPTKDGEYVDLTVELAMLDTAQP